MLHSRHPGLAGLTTQHRSPSVPEFCMMLTFHNPWTGETDQEVGATPQKAMDDLARRTIRALVMNTQDMPEGKASAGMSLPLYRFIALRGQAVHQRCKHQKRPVQSVLDY